MDDDYLPEDFTYLIDCTCEHEPEQHDWDCCTVPECKCEGHWEY